MPEKTSSWFVYMVQCADGSFYTGASTNVEKRVKMHNSGKGAKYTHTRLPVVLVYSEKCANHGAALQREWAMKKLTRVEKQQLING
jgi:predicted GIY-YIG superfamily endonuclease